MKELKVNEYIWHEIDVANKGIPFKCPQMFFDPGMLIPWDFQNSTIYKMKEYIKFYPETARERWKVHFGAFIPQIDYNYDKDKILIVIHNINEWISEYPEKIVLYNRLKNYKEEMVTLDRSFVCQFNVMRRILYQHQQEND